MRTIYPVCTVVQQYESYSRYVPDERERDDDDDVDAEGDDARSDEHRHHVLVPEGGVNRGDPGVLAVCGRGLTI